MRALSLGAVCLAWILACASPAYAKSYSAERFDAVVRVLPDGTLDVTETVVFRFDDGTFREVFRTIPAKRTDGIEIVRAEMAGKPLPPGKEPGTVEVRSGGERVRVTWRFNPIEGVTREFVLNYRVRGAVRREENADLLIWRGLPGEHGYRMNAARIRFELPRPLARAPELRVRRAGEPLVNADGSVVDIRAEDVRANGWIDTTLTFPRGAIDAPPPQWQQRASRHAARAPIWMIVSALVIGAGLVLLFGWRQSYEPPPPDHAGADLPQTTPPDSSSPAVAGVLAAGGRPALEHAMAALFSLADRGGLKIEEMPRSNFGMRDFRLTRTRTLAGLASHEEAALRMAFKDADTAESVPLSKARTRLMWRLRQFASALNHDLASAGLLDEGRRHVRARYTRAGAVILIAGGLAFIPVFFLRAEYGAWPAVIPAAIMLVGLAACIFAGATTPFSNEGVRRSRQWRAFQRHLRAVARRKESAAVGVGTILPFAVALGLAETWARFLKHQAHPMPGWFHALPGDHHGAFLAFVSHGGATGSSGSSSGGGAAGGGASGAR